MNINVGSHLKKLSQIGPSFEIILLIFKSGQIADKFFFLTSKKTIFFHFFLVFISFYSSGIPCNAAILKKKYQKTQRERERERAKLRD